MKSSLNVTNWFLGPQVRTRRSRHRIAPALVERLEDRTLLSATVLDTSEATPSVQAIEGQTTGLFHNLEGTSDGYTLFSPNTTTSTYLLDKDGNVINEWVSDYPPGLHAYLLEDGSLVRAAVVDNTQIDAAGGGGLIERFDWEGNKVWEFSYNDESTFEDAVWQHHDIEILPNGNILLIAWEVKTEAEATQAGRDPDLPGAGHLFPDHIVEIQPDLESGVGGEVVWEWHVWDHLVQEFDDTKDNYYTATGVEDHPELIDLNYVSTFDEGGGQAEDWTHANGIDYNPELDQIVLSVREFSEFWVIDHSTTTEEAASHTGGDSGKGGDLLYRWGNPQAYDTGDASDRILYYQHDAKWILEGRPGEGNITVFNNGLGQPGDDLTSVLEIEPPVDELGNYDLTPGSAYGPESAVWTYTAAPEDFSSIISGTQRLANGNTLITYGPGGTFVEVTPEGEEVWRYVNPYTQSGMLGPTDPIPPFPFGDLLENFTFRATDYAADFFVGDNPAQLETGVLENVTDEWQTVEVGPPYASMVVVATVVTQAGDPPVVTRIRSAEDDSFEIRVQRADGTDDPVTGVTVQYLVVEEGVYTEAEHGFTMEAVKVDSTVTDRRGSWVGAQQTYANTYANPVVLGQVMSSNDDRFSTFWSRGATRQSAPDASNLYIGKHVGEDPEQDRADETIGYIVVEEGVGQIGDWTYSAGVGPDTVKGTGDAPPYQYSVDGIDEIFTAVASQTAMDGGNGGWGVFSGADPFAANMLNLAIQEDTAADAETRHTTEQVAYIAFAVPVASPDDPQLHTAELEDVTDQWQTVTLDDTYDSMVVVATVVAQDGDPPVVARIRNADGNSFEISVQRADGLPDPVPGVRVQYLVLEEGVYTQEQHGFTAEAIKYTSTTTDHKGSWIGTEREYRNEYDTPVVLGQVMSANDDDASAFWSRGANRQSAPDANNLYVGKHVAEDPDQERLDEVVGYVVIEAGTGQIGSLKYSAGVGGDTVRGVDNAPPYPNSVTGLDEITNAVASQTAMDGNDGGWGVFYGPSPFDGLELDTAISEDTLGDAERRHTTEQVAFIAFEETLTALDVYVATPDPSYGYSEHSTIVGPGFTAHVLDMTSQTWQSSEVVQEPVWQHWVTVIVPDGVSSNTAILFVDGGSTGAAPTAPDDVALAIALQSGMTVIHLPTVPNQPQVFLEDGVSRTEDSIIAFTFDKYMDTGDETYPLLLPMVKSAVAAMDTAQDYGASEGLVIDEFIVTGASKRGWTTWLTAAVDSRVTAIAPLVIDVLNMDEQIPHHKDNYEGVTVGTIEGYSVAIGDYVEQDILERLDTPEGQELLEIVDPFEYRDRLTLPKYLVNATGDEFFVPDSGQFYLGELEGPTYVRYVPNVGHGLNEDAIIGAINFFAAIDAGSTLPTYDWTVENDGAVIRVNTVEAPVQVRMWQATNPDSLDFRLPTFGPNWTSTVLTDQGGGEFVAQVTPPVTGGTAIFAEMTYIVNGAPLIFTTEISIVTPVAAPLTLGQSAIVPTQAGQEVSPSELAAIRSAAIDAWAAAGATPAQLAALATTSLKVADLPGTDLGQAAGQTVTIDVDAAGQGWFIDSTPGDNAEFSTQVGTDQLRAQQGSEAAGGVDLLSTVIHEFGHVLGVGHLDSTQPADVMSESLLPGIRRLPDAADLVDSGNANSHPQSLSLETVRSLGSLNELLDFADGRIDNLDELFSNLCDLDVECPWD